MKKSIHAVKKNIHDMEVKMEEIICIVCPNGCHMQIDGKEQIKVIGNLCKRGEEFAIQELTNPMRSLTTTVRTTSKDMPMLPVRTKGEIPKSKIEEAMMVLNKIEISNSVTCGEVILKNILGCDCDIIATCSLII